MLLIMFQNAIYCRQTPIEVLHTILLGAEKYLLAKTMKSLSNENKAKVTARIESCDFSPFPQKLASNISKTYGSLVGRDIKVWAQVAVYILMDIIPNDELEVWIHLSNVCCL
jgi:hypothetical protein